MFLGFTDPVPEEMPEHPLSPATTTPEDSTSLPENASVSREASISRDEVVISREEVLDAGGSKEGSDPDSAPSSPVHTPGPSQAKRRKKVD